MSGFSIVSLGLLFIVTVLGTGRFFYFREINKSIERKMSQFHMNLEEIECSFEQIVYFVTLPSHLPLMQTTTKDDIHLQYDMEKGLFPKLIGLKVYIDSGEERRMIAYLPMEQFRIPKLDRLYVKRELTGEMYQKTAAAKVMLVCTQEEIKEEVYHQLKVGQFDIGGGV
ncbi:hypothetical protein [Salimicrobium halophilum]|uniref:Uncharacterized protein n=1 Tax=Salimicrobium halophilum TaxID=86666 RepID=A0A1G8T3N4_9BACI|nr:hypothetical protein [Salimicrobium halophilum]SDJ36249.1 hypothetical protein SAMN04490247_1693 [Salimicrobium halophilum]